MQIGYEESRQAAARAGAAQTQQLLEALQTEYAVQSTQLCDHLLQLLLPLAQPALPGDEARPAGDPETLGSGFARAQAEFTLHLPRSIHQHRRLAAAGATHQQGAALAQVQPCLDSGNIRLPLPGAHMAADRG